MKRIKNNRGFTAFFAVLVSSLALSVGLSIYDLLVREIALSQTTTQSQYAVFAADTGAECALYWDSQYRSVSAGDIDGSAFPIDQTTPGSDIAVAGQAYCNTFDITVNGPPTADLPLYAPSSCVANAWCRTSNATAATTTFTVYFPAPQPYCATVIVAKYAEPGEPAKTTITSRGFNTCVTTGLIRLERALQVNY